MSDQELPFTIIKIIGKGRINTGSKLLCECGREVKTLLERCVCEQEAYTHVYMDVGSNKRMLSGETVQAWLERLDDDDMELTVGNYRVTPSDYPYVFVKSASDL